jgi:hypothetical protein
MQSIVQQGRIVVLTIVLSVDVDYISTHEGGLPLSVPLLICAAFAAPIKPFDTDVASVQGPSPS